MRVVLSLLLGLCLGCVTLPTPIALPTENMDVIRGNVHCNYVQIVSTPRYVMAEYSCLLPLPCAALKVLAPNQIGCPP